MISSSQPAPEDSGGGVLHIHQFEKPERPQRVIEEEIDIGILAGLPSLLFAAAAVAEWVFDVPGAAVLFVKSAALADWNVLALIVFVFAVIKLMADLGGHLGARFLADPEVPA